MEIALIGAGGRMGSGIALLLLQEYTMQKSFRLICIDENEKSLDTLRVYLRKELLRYAEKNINALRKHVEDNPLLISNKEIIDNFLLKAFDSLRFCLNIIEAKKADIALEAIFEEPSLKKKLFKELSKICSRETLFCSNTSAIPIHTMNKGIETRLVGFHFYNPASVQKVMEVVIPDTVSRENKEKTLDLGKKLKKTLVFSKDVPGFIGNCLFGSDMVFCLKLSEKLSKTMPLAEALGLINDITAKEMHRPMGIFTLMDFVGLPVCKNILKILKLKSPLLDRLTEGPAPLKGATAPEILRKKLAKEIAENEQKTIQRLISKGVASEEGIQMILKLGFHHG